MGLMTDAILGRADAQLQLTITSMIVALSPLSCIVTTVFVLSGVRRLGAAHPHRIIVHWHALRVRRRYCAWSTLE